ncbi:MAG: MBL fold metallo-hydrolase [Oscillibacter sp.]|jgi:L-ascorbate metabolism protein UlaG (beta-lactamase superfamily)|nr:MBL fold metallo-hydrolase [Oscillibacter sp.]MCI9001516.1 MBL fold metallo-hydrolase [Oscillibacter sp.]
MRVTFLEHSGFLVETGFAALLFDWWKGELPALPPGVPLYVFASHVHPDHFDPKIFALNDGNRDVSFLLGKGVSLDPRHLQRWGVSPETVEKARVRQGGQTLSLPQAEIETLSSTDEGVAFLVTLPDGRTVFHAGDLNWWHWEGEDRAWNRNMEVNFKKYTEPLRGRKIDLAMLPLDPRLGEAGFWGPAYFLETADIRHFLPMHQWGDFEFSRKFLEENPAFTERTVPVERAGQVFTF